MQEGFSPVGDSKKQISTDIEFSLLNNNDDDDISINAARVLASPQQNKIAPVDRALTKQTDTLFPSPIHNSHAAHIFPSTAHIFPSTAHKFPPTADEPSLIVPTGIRLFSISTTTYNADVHTRVTDLDISTTQIPRSDVPESGSSGT